MSALLRSSGYHFQIANVQKRAGCRSRAGCAAADRIESSADDAYFVGMHGANMPIGGGGNEALHGQGGDGQLFGGQGTDRLEGGNANCICAANGSSFNTFTSNQSVAA